MYTGFQFLICSCKFTEIDIQTDSVTMHETANVDWKVRMYNEYSLMQQTFIQNNISHEKMEECPTFPHTEHKGSCICHMLWVNACPQVRNLRFSNRTTVRQLLVLLHQFGTCDHQDASSEDQKKWEVTWCQVPTQSDRWQPWCSNLDGSVSSFHHTALTCYQTNITFLVFWRSTWWKQIPKCCGSVKNCLAVVL